MSRFLWFTVYVECDVFLEAPYPIQVISPRQGDDAYRYRMIWANPKTGGRPIEKYTIKFRQVMRDF